MSAVGIHLAEWWTKLSSDATGSSQAFILPRQKELERQIITVGRTGQLHLAPSIPIEAAGGDVFAKVAALAITVAIFVAVLIILRPRGLRVQLSACSFVASLVVTQLMMKALSSPPFDYRFPATVTALHFLSAWVFCHTYWFVVGDRGKTWPGSLGSSRRYVVTILPIACSLPLSVVLNNEAMIYVGTGVNAVVGTLTPVTTAVLSSCLGRSLAKTSWIGVALAFFGALLIVHGEARGVLLSRGKEPETGEGPSFALVGLALSVLAVLTRSVKVVLQDKLLQPRAYANDGQAAANAPSPMHVWALQAPPCFILAVFYALLSESIATAWQRLTREVFALMLCTCLTATWLNIMGMFLIRDLGASSMQIVGKLNTLITVSLSVAYFGEHLPAEVALGTCVVLCGVYIFERGEATHAPPAKQLQR